MSWFGGGRVARIAVIDDNVLVRQLVGEVLAEEGYDVLEFDGQRGVFGQLQAERPDLLMLDLHLGAQESGWELLDSIRADPALRHIPVIIVTAGPEELARHAAEIKHMGYRTLEKPFDLDEMSATIRMALTTATNGYDPSVTDFL
jgi:CheY-like chemotaxis protein